MAERGEELSPREKEVLELVATGATNRQVAQDLYISVNTIKVHLRNIYTKLDVESRTEATLIAIRDGLIDVPIEESEAKEPSSEAAEATEAASSPSPPAESQSRPLPPLPWPKRLALVVGLLLVVLASAATWPRSQSVAVPPDPGTDAERNGNGGGALSSESTNWQALAPMTTARSRFALVSTSDYQLFAIAGETNGGVTGAVERYDPALDRWTPLAASKPTRVSNIGAALIGDRIYVPGGQTAEGTSTSTVEAYDLIDETWHEVAPLPQPLSGYALATFEKEIYLFGGRNDRGYVDKTYIYDPQEDQWREGQEMPTRRAYAAAATIGSQIYVVGGYDGQRERNTCEVYRPRTETWQACEPLAQGRGGLGLAAVANRLYVIGGGWSDYLGLSEEYDPDQNSRKFFGTPVNQQWRNMAVAATPNKFYAAGGWKGNYLNGVWEYLVMPWQIHIPAMSP